MSKKLSIGYLVLVFIQAFHSIEEYFGELWHVFPPATFLCSLVSKDLHLGFLIINIGLFISGILFWYFVVRPNHNLAMVVIWFWIGIELVNGIGHPVWTILEKGYTPGVITAPFLFVVAIFLIKTMRSEKTKINTV